MNEFLTNFEVEVPYRRLVDLVEDMYCISIYPKEDEVDSTGLVPTFGISPVNNLGLASNRSSLWDLFKT